MIFCSVKSPLPRLLPYRSMVNKVNTDVNQFMGQFGISLKQIVSKYALYTVSPTYPILPVLGFE